MKSNPDKHHRRSIRMKGYDYSQAGLYFITMCCQNRACLFGIVENGKMNLNDAGIMVQNEWLKLPERFNNIKLHQFVVMPNHFHAILEIPEGATLVVAQNDNNQVAQNNVLNQNTSFTTNNDKEAQPQGIAPTMSGRKTVGDMVGAFQSIVTVNYIRGIKNSGWPPFNRKLWQRNYYESIIRNEQSYINISNYILNNPTKWNNDSLK